MSTEKKETENSCVASLEAKMPSLYREFKELVIPSEIADEFHLFVFMTMISALAGDKLYFKEGNDIIYPNLWTMLVGESGISRKSSAFRSAVKILAKTGKVNLLASKGSPEGFFAELVEHDGVGLLRHSELGALLGALRKDYLGGFVDELCEYYDPCPAGLVKRLANKKLGVDHLAISWIAATTPDSLNRCEANERVASGFLPRWNIIFGGQPPAIIHFRLPKHQSFFDDFVKKFTGLCPEKACEIKFGDEAMAMHKKWYTHHRPQVQDGAVGYFQIRILEVVKKYAVLLAFLNSRNNVSKEDMILAVKFGNYFFSTAKRLLTTEIAKNKNERIFQRILKAIQRLKAEGRPTNQREIMRRTSLIKRDFKTIIETLEIRGSVVKSEDGQWEIGPEDTANDADKTLKNTDSY